MLGSAPKLTQSKQLYHLALSGGECLLSRAHPKLVEYIDYYWLLNIQDELIDLEVIPDTAIDLVLSPAMVKFSALYFPVTEKFSIPLEGPMQYVGICFRGATALTLLGSTIGDLQLLRNGSETIASLGIGELTQQIQHKTKLSEITLAFDEFWLKRLASSEDRLKHKRSLSTPQLITILEESLGLESVAQLCESLQISERQFRRLSNELFGLSPKKIQNVLRLQTALDDLFSCEAQQLRDLYYDDSHRIRELKRLTGFTPLQILRMAEKYNKT